MSKTQARHGNYDSASFWEKIAMIGKIGRKPTLTSRRAFLTQAIGSGLALGAASSVRPVRAATEKVTFQLDWIPYGRHAPYYVALDKGFYSRKGLDVTIVQGTGSVQGLRALGTGQVNFLFGDFGSMIAVRSRDGVRAKALACMYQKTPHTIFFIKGAGIVKPKDLEGKKLAYSPGDKIMFPAFAIANRIDESKISWLSVDPNTKNVMLLNRNADSMMTYIFTKPVLQKAAKPGDVIDGFIYSDWGTDFYSNGIAAMEDYIIQKPDIVRNFVQATMEGVEYALTHVSESVSIMKKYQPQLDEEVAGKEIAILHELIMNPGQRLGGMTREKMQHTVELTIKYLDLKVPVAVDQVFTNEFLK
jgi:NitT/TauT family transport system substrate-binding protein